MTVKTASSLHAQHAVNYLLLLTSWNLFIAYGAWFAKKTGHGVCDKVSGWLIVGGRGKSPWGKRHLKGLWAAAAPKGWSSSLQQPAGFQSSHCLLHATTQRLLFHLLVIAVITDNNEEPRKAIAFLNWVYSPGAFQPQVDELLCFLSASPKQSGWDC